MIKVDIFSGFLGSGKTTLIKKLINEAYEGEKIVLIENEFGEIGIDGGFLKEAGIQINEMNSGCICCSLVGDFGEALKKVVAEYSPERILIEPSGVGKLSDIIEAVENLNIEELVLNGSTTVVDAKKAKIYMKNFGEFFNNQVEHASSIVLSHTRDMDEKKLADVVALLKEHNHNANLITTDWTKIDGKKILDTMENKSSIECMLKKIHDHDDECECHEHHHHDDECGCHEHHHHDDECGCHEHHHHDDECGCHEHHHHDDECECHEHHHHDEECGCHGHHHHHADEVFDSIGIETTKKFTEEDINEALLMISGSDYGNVLRAKGIVEAKSADWIHFDYVPLEPDVRRGAAEVIGRICVIGTDLNEEKIRELFGV